MSDYAPPHSCIRPRPGRSAFAPLHSKRRLKLFSDTIKRWRRAFVYFGSAQNKRLCQAESHSPPTSGSVTQVSEDAPRRQTRTPTALTRLPGVPLSSTAPPRLATTCGAAEGRGGGGQRRDRARRHKARLERSESRRGAPGTHLQPALTGREAGGRLPPVPSGPLPARRPSTARRGRSVAAAQAPQSVLGEPRRKDARALRGGEVIKGKEPAAGGSGRFCCSRSCCLGFGPPEERSLKGPGAGRSDRAARPTHPPPSRSSVRSRPPRPTGTTWRRRCRST